MTPKHLDRDDDYGQGASDMEGWVEHLTQPKPQGHERSEGWVDQRLEGLPIEKVHAVEHASKQGHSHD